MGLLRFLRRRPLDDDGVAPTPAPMIMEAEHWELAGVDFYRFFEALSEFALVDALLVLADGSPSSELQAFYDQHARQPEVALLNVLRPEFRDGVFLPATAPLLSALAALADHHASPEVAIFLAVADTRGVILEWFDAPDDPVSVAAFVQEERIARFAEETGATYRRRHSVSR